MKTVESFDKHYSFIILTEENEKQEPCRQHSTLSLIKYPNQYPKIWILKGIKVYQKKWYPKIRKHPQKSTQNDETSPYHEI